MSTSAITRSSIAGVGPGVGAGMWTLVEKKVFTEAASSYEFLNCNGDVDRRYLIRLRLINSYAGSNQTRLLLGGSGAVDTGNNYSCRYSYGSGTGTQITGSETISDIGNIPQNGTLVATIELDAMTGSNRNYIESLGNLLSTSVVDEAQIVGQWHNTSTNITNVKVICAQQFAAGSFVELWKLGPPPPVAMGEWSLVERYTVSGSAVTSKTFSGLSGDSDRRYKIVTHIIGGSGYGNTYLQFNNNTTPSNYWTVAAYDQGTSRSVSSYNNLSGYFISNTSAEGRVADGVCEVFAASGNKRTMRSILYSVGSAYDSTACSYVQGCWINISDNITSMTLTGSVNGIGVGSYIELWKLGA